MMTLIGREGLSLEVRGHGELTVSRDGSSRVEHWGSAEDLAVRLVQLGVRPEQIDLPALHCGE